MLLLVIAIVPSSSRALESVGDGGRSERIETVEHSAAESMRNGDFADADRAYSRLVSQNIRNPATALRFAFAKWHLRQEYRAQAELLRLLGSGRMTAGNSVLVEKTLDSLFDDMGVLRMLREEGVPASDADAYGDLEAFWEHARDAMAKSATNNDREGLERAVNTLFGEGRERAWYALWRGYGLIYTREYARAEDALRLVLRSDPDTETTVAANDGLRLISELRGGRQSGGILDRLAELSTTVEGQFSGQNVDEQLGQAEELLRLDDYDASSSLLEAIRDAPMSDEMRGKYFQLLGEVRWGGREFFRANQSYVAASVLATERFTLSAALFQLAEYAAMTGNREDAADFAARSAGVLPDQDWKLRQVGGFFIGLDMPERGIAYLEASLTASATLHGDALSYAELANAHNRIGDKKKYLQYARDYVETVSKIGNDMTREEDGLRAFFQGEMLSADGEAEAANAAYGQALERVTDRFRRSEILMNMAEYQAGLKNTEQAVSLAERAMEELPEQNWKLLQVGGFLTRLGRAEKGGKLFERALESARSSEERIAALTALAGMYGEQGDREKYLRAAEEYVTAVTAVGRALTPGEEGLAAFYQGEIHNARGEFDTALEAYERAVNRVTDTYRLSDIYMKIAGLRARRGENEQAAELAERSANMLPNEPWKLEQVGNFLLGLDMPEEVFNYFERFAAMNGSGDGSGVFATMADAYATQKDQERYLEYARRYIDAITAGGRTPSAAEEGLAGFYRGEILSADGESARAFEEYAKAVELTGDPFSRSDLYMKMAEYQAKRGEREQAADLAERAVEAIPDAAWRLRQVGELFERLNMPEKAIAYFERWLRAGDSVADRAAAYSALAEIHKKIDDQEKYLRYARDYVATVAADGYAPGTDEKAWLHFYEGEILSAEDKPDEAYLAYSQASKLFTDKYHLSDTFIRMARYKAARGDKDEAIDFAERSADLLPDAAWRVIEVGDVYNGLEMPKKAVEYYRRALELSPKTGNLAAIYTSLAEVYKKLDDKGKYIEYARLYIDALETRQQLSDNEKGLRAFYRGEIQEAGGDEDGAYLSFTEAAELFTDAFRLSDIAMKQAEYHAKRDDKARAAKFAERSASILPDQVWRQRGVGDFFGNLDMMDKAIHYYEQALELSKTPETRAAIFASLADAHKKTGDKERYISYAREYVAAISQAGGELGAYENGLRAYYQGEIFVAEGNALQAYRAYENATRFIDDPYRLSEIFVTLAKYNADWGKWPLSAEQAKRAADLLPDKDWRVGEVVDILDKVGRCDEAEVVVRRAVALNPEDNAHLFRKLSQLRMNAKDRAGALRYNAEYIDHLTKKMERNGTATRDQRQELWNARDYQTGVSRTWGLDSYYYGKRWTNHDYFLGMSHELFRNFSLSNGMWGKFYIQYGGTVKALYSGRYYYSGEQYSWTARPNLGETANAIFGVSINPFSKLSALSVNAEYLASIGNNVKNDFRFRVGYDKTSGEKPRPFGNRWLYWKTYMNTTYSTRNNDITSMGDFRLGATFLSDKDRNLLVMPHVLTAYSYGGKTVEKGARWGFDVGAGVAVRKWLRGGKYHTPRSYVDLHLYYHKALTHDRNNGFGFTLSTSF